MTTEKREAGSGQPYRQRQGSGDGSLRCRWRKGRIHRARHDRENQRQGFLRGAQLWRFLGIGDDFYPLPWPSLKYNIELGGYQTMVLIEKIKGAPKYARNASWDWESGDPPLDDYYGAVPT
jgi:hypothetical protein